MKKMINYNTCITISTIITCTQWTSISQKTLFTSVWSDRHNIHEEHIKLDIKFTRQLAMKAGSAYLLANRVMNVI